ncbi:hypothetical protein AFL94_11585 [Arthrobacter sp. LS16]|nr:hypothetical protein AFL94_11585 [Arthrobacter sp. LS16]
MRGFHHLAAHRDRSKQRLPPEGQRRLRVGCQLTSLGTGAGTGEGPATAINILENQHPGIGHTDVVDGRQRHGVRLGHSGIYGRLQPSQKQRLRFFMHRLDSSWRMAGQGW